MEEGHYYPVETYEQQQHDDKILQIEDAIKELLEYIKVKDELHWKGLNGL